MWVVGINITWGNDFFGQDTRITKKCKKYLDAQIEMKRIHNNMLSAGWRVDAYETYNILMSVNSPQGKQELMIWNREI